jgi:hypothetical protein
LTSSKFLQTPPSLPKRSWDWTKGVSTSAVVSGRAGDETETRDRSFLYSAKRTKLSGVVVPLVVDFKIPLVPELAGADRARELRVFAAPIFGVFVQGGTVFVAFAAGATHVGKICKKAKLLVTKSR